MKKEIKRSGGHTDRFEDYLQELEGIVSDLEEGNLGLETSLKKYETGVKALKKCYEILDGMEKRIELLTKDKEGNFRTRPFKPTKIRSKESSAEDENQD